MSNAQATKTIKTNSYGDSFMVGDRAAWSTTQAEQTGEIIRFISGDLAVITVPFSVVYVEIDSLYPVN